MNKLISALVAGGAVAGASLLAVASPEILETIVKQLSDTAQSQFARDCFIFSLAAMIHAGRMKKEIRANFEGLTISIDKVAKAFRDDLESHSDRLDNLAKRVASLELQQNNSKEN